MNSRVSGTLMTLVGLLFGGWQAVPTASADSVKDFECHGAAVHIFTNTKAADSSYEMTEHYCEGPNGNRQGLSKISYTDLTGENPSTYTWGHYLDGQRGGRWITITVTGEFVGQCIYANGQLQKQVGTCFEE